MKAFLITDADDPGLYIGGAVLADSLDEVASRLEGEIKYDEEEDEYFIWLPADRLFRVWIDKTGKEIESRRYSDPDNWIEDEELEAKGIDPKEIEIIKKYLLRDREISLGDIAAKGPINDKCAFVIREVPLLL